MVGLSAVHQKMDFLNSYITASLKANIWSAVEVNLEKFDGKWNNLHVYRLNFNLSKEKGIKHG
jgi:hypothetical protein